MYQKLYSMTKYPDGHPHLARSLNNLGTLLNARGEYGKAQPYYEHALAVCHKLYPMTKYPDGHPHLATSLNNLGFLLQARGEYGNAQPCHEQALAMYTAPANRLLNAADAEAVRFLQAQPLSRDALLSLTQHRPNAAERLYPQLWHGRAAATRILERRHASFLAVADHPDVRQRWDELTDIRRRLHRLFLDLPKDLKACDDEARDLTQRKERLERELAQRIPILTEQKELDRLTPADLQRALPPYSAFVDLLRYTVFEQDPKKPGQEGEKRTPHYVAFVLTRDQIHQVPLGEAGPSEQALADWRRAIQDRLDSPAAEQLRRRVWEPLAKKLPAAMQILYLAPDGDLTRLPWGALPGDQPGTILLERYAFAVVPHGRFLLARLRDTTKPDFGGTLVAVGGVRYDDKPAPVQQPRRADVVAPIDRDGAARKWRYLEGTVRELQMLRELPGVRVLPLSGADAGTARLFAELPKARMAHVATHGSFALAPDLEEQKRQATQLHNWQFRPAEPTLEVGLGVRNPMAFSGLVLAGANQPEQAGPDGGILTAEALLALPLEKLQLCVLSACQTGLGVQADRECVYGLQRSLHVSGCKNVIASLWNVPDDATAALMALFYDKLLRQHKSPFQALREAQLTLYWHPERLPVLAQGERGSGPDFGKTVKLPASPPAEGKGTKRSPAKLWAAFFLSGVEPPHS
jgi:CHAT domain-containing protein